MIGLIEFFFILLIGFIIFYKICRGSFKHIKNIKILSIILLVTVLFIIMIPNVVTGRTIATEDKKYNKYIMNINRVQEVHNTKVKINKALMDINKLSFNIGVKGSSKIVGIEIKKDLKDDEPLKDIKGLWLGNKFMYQYNSYSISFKSEKFLKTLYIICYLSSGEEINFKIDDEKNIEKIVKTIDINKDIIDKTGRVIRIKKFIKGATYGQLYSVSDINFSGLDVVANIGEKQYKNLSSTESGGPLNIYTIPIENKKSYFKIKLKNTGEEFNVNIQ